MSNKHLGFIGVGQMGGPMAGRLLDAGYTLTIFDARGSATEALAARGARVVATPAAVASECETVLLSLPTPAIVKEVVTGNNGVVHGSRAKVVVDLSTTGARVEQEVAAALEAKGMELVDSPVSGGVAGATKGTLAVMTAGNPATLERLRPVLDIFGKVFILGDKPGMGQTMKLANNLLSATAMAITSEAMVMGVKAGLDPRVMLDVINAGTGRNSASQDKFPRAVVPRLFNFGFTNGLMYKDVKLCLEEAGAMNVPMFVASAVGQSWYLACQELGPNDDFTGIVKYLEKWAGVEVKAPENKG